jgi:hypothetical protein
MAGHGKAACAEFYRGWFDAFPDAHVEVNEVYIIDDVVVEEGSFTGTHNGVLRNPAGDIRPPAAPWRRLTFTCSASATESMSRST